MRDSPEVVMIGARAHGNILWAVGSNRGLDRYVVTRALVHAPPASLLDESMHFSCSSQVMGYQKKNKIDLSIPRPY